MLEKKRAYKQAERESQAMWIKRRKHVGRKNLDANDRATVNGCFIFA